MNITHLAPSTTSSATAISPASAPATRACPISARFGSHPPADFARLAAGMDWREIVETFAPSSEHLHLADLSTRPLGRGRYHYEALLTLPHGHTRRLTTTAYGSFAAVTDMLHTLGLPVHTQRFHQVHSGDTWCTFVQAESNRAGCWAMGVGTSSADSAIAALLSAASLLHLH